MSARDNYPKAEYAGADLHWCVTLHEAHYAGAMTELDSLRAELLALRTALIKWKHREPTVTWEYIEFVLNLIPDDNWGIT